MPTRALTQAIDFFLETRCPPIRDSRLWLRIRESMPLDCIIISVETMHIKKSHNLFTKECRQAQTRQSARLHNRNRRHSVRQPHDQATVAPRIRDRRSPPLKASWRQPALTQPHAE